MELGGVGGISCTWSGVSPSVECVHGGSIGELEVTGIVGGIVSLPWNSPVTHSAIDSSGGLNVEDVRDGVSLEHEGGVEVTVMASEVVLVVCTSNCVIHETGDEVSVVDDGASWSDETKTSPDTSGGSSGSSGDVPGREVNPTEGCLECLSSIGVVKSGIGKVEGGAGGIAECDCGGIGLGDGLGSAEDGSKSEDGGL